MPEYRFWIIFLLFLRFFDFFNFKKEITEEQLNGIKELTRKSYQKFIEKEFIENE